MSQLGNKSADTEPSGRAGSQRIATGPSTARVFLVGAVVIIAVVAALLLAIRTFLFPVWEANSEGARQVATAEAQLAQARTEEALTPQATATLAVAPGALPTVAPTRPPTATPAPAAQPTVAPTPTVAALPAAGASATPATLPTVSPELDAEISAAYEKYFQVTSDALLNLDPTPLSEVAAGQALAGLEQTIEEDRTQGRALQTNVRHQFVVLGVHGDLADLADRYEDSSIYVDPVSHQPLPGQTIPASPDIAPVVAAVYHFQRIDGVWKVVGGESSR